MTCSARLAFLPALLLGACTLLPALGSGCTPGDRASDAPTLAASPSSAAAPPSDGLPSASSALPAGAPGEAIATFAGGCFWCMEAPFEALPGVTAVISGYTGGQTADPTYAQVGSGATGHAEAIEVHFDPRRIHYEELLEVFWRQIDPTDPGGQFVDRGSQYRTVVFVHDAAQRVAALASRERLAASGRFAAPLVTPVEDAGPFYPAEEYHQDYHDKQPSSYERYRRGSGRDAWLDSTWGEQRELQISRRAPGARASGPWVRPTDEQLRQRLTPLQYHVTREEGTERPFENAYWDEKRPGLFVDVISGEPLFSSADKFASGTGWPSFTRPLSPQVVLTRDDMRLGALRSEVRSALADSHLGHVFDDGPEPTGLRYCINSAALRFVPLEQLQAEGLAEYLPLFDR